jgi:hypothetical protein
MSKSGLVAAGVFCGLAGAVALAVGSFMLAHQCTNGEWYKLDDDATHYDSYVCFHTWAGSLQLAGAACMIGAARGAMIFACGPNLDKNHYFSDGDIEANSTPTATPVNVPN